MVRHLYPSEVDETKLCILLVAAVRTPDPFGKRLKTRTRRSSGLLRGHLEGLCFLEPLNGFEYVNLETELNCFSNKNMRHLKFPGKFQEGDRSQSD